MAKLTDLTLKTAIDDDDVIYFVDVSDTTDDPAGSSFKIKKSDLALGGLPSASVVRTEIDRIDAGAGGTFTFNPDPLDLYDRYIIAGKIRGLDAAASEAIKINLNADAVDANYHYQDNWSSNGSPSGTDGALPYIAIASAAGAVAGNVTSVMITIEDPNNADRKDALGTFNGEHSADLMFTGQRGVQSSITAAITEIFISGVNTANLVGELVLYGEKKVTGGGGGGGVPAGTCLKTELDRIDLSVTGAAAFTVVPGDAYDRYIIEGTARSDHTGADNLVLEFNGQPSGTSYHYQNLLGGNGVSQANEGQLAYVTLIPGSNSAANNMGQVRVTVEDPNGAQNKTAKGDFTFEASTDFVYMGFRGMRSSVTAALTNLDFSAAAGLMVGELILYGEKTTV